MEAKLSKFQKSREFVNTLDVTSSPEFSYEGDIDDDFEREAAFLKQAQSAACIALPRLKALGVPIFRPADYFAEMAKSDNHMQKVRHHIHGIQKEKENREAAKRLREEKRYALKVQSVSEERKRKEKRKLLEAVKKHRKGMKSQLETMLNNASKMHLDEDEEKKARKMNKISRNSRDKKYGFGGVKKRSKRNDKLSFEDPFFGRNKSGGNRQFKQQGKRSKSR